MKIINKNSNFTKSELLEIAQNEGAVLQIDKETEWTSFDAVAKIRSYLKIKKVGHSGTLDPAATGLLLIGIGKGTKLLTELTGLSKAYSGSIKFGATTKTDDCESEEENHKATDSLNLDIINENVKHFNGQILQLPPRYSAKKIKGKKMYDLARKGIEFERKPSQVEIFKFDILDYNNEISNFYVECSKGTYIRSLARDLGEKVGTGAYLKTLRREKIGDYNVDLSLKISDFIEKFQ